LFAKNPLHQHLERLGASDNPKDFEKAFQTVVQPKRKAATKAR
jgi:hypothetical protein